jgi:hypothetical protein
MQFVQGWADYSCLRAMPLSIELHIMLQQWHEKKYKKIHLDLLVDALAASGKVRTVILYTY